MAGKSADTTVVFGALCESAPRAPAGAERMLRRKIADAVLLPFQVEPRHMGNVVRCMLLMDVMGLMVTGRHRKLIMAEIPKCDKSAVKAAMADTVVREGRSFKAYCAETLAREELEKKSKKIGGKNRKITAAALSKRSREISVELLTYPLFSK